MKSVRGVLKITIGIAITASLELTFGMQPWPYWPPPPWIVQATQQEQVPQRLEKPRYGEGVEAQAVAKELGDFNYETSPAFKAIQDYFGKDVRTKELKGIILTARFWLLKRKGIVLPELTRNEKRSLQLMVKYIERHYGYSSNLSAYDIDG